MYSLRLLCLLIIATSLAFIQSCKVRDIYLCPILDSLSPSFAPEGATVSIVGKNFITDKKYYKVNVEGNPNLPIDIIDVPDTKTLRFMVPQSMGDGRISVSFANGKSCSNALGFYYQLTVKNINEFAKGFYGQLV